MTDIYHRLSSWRSFVATSTPAQEFPATAGLAEAHHRQQVQRSQRLLLENLAAYEAFAEAVLRYVANGKDNRSPELQQRLTDYAAAILQAYEVTSGRALQAAINNVLEGLPREVIRTIYQELPTPQQTLLRRLLGM
jgi:hypothetical protein